MRAMDDTRGRRVARAAMCLALAASAFGCASPGPAPVIPPSVSYDGHYVGTIQLTGAASGIQPSDCSTPTDLSFDVKNNGFSYAQGHPRVAGTAPDLTQQSTTTVYNARVAPDGSISGTSADFGGTIAGRIDSTGKVTGQINGTLCYYSFAASLMK